MNPIEQIPATAQFKAKQLGLYVSVWLATLAAGFLLLAQHAGTPGQGSRNQSDWPIDSGLVEANNRFTLVMIVHPQCPCSRASLSELANLMARSNGELGGLVLFAEPPGLMGDSTTSVLWDSASHIPGVKCLRDPGGKLTARFGAETSGQVFLYDSSGALKFNGGITGSRGHAGDNDGTDAVQAIVDGETPATSRTPVYGCALR